MWPSKKERRKKKEPALADDLFYGDPGADHGEGAGVLDVDCISLIVIHGQVSFVTALRNEIGFSSRQIFFFRSGG